MLRREHHEGRAPQRIGAGGEYLDDHRLADLRSLKIHRRAFAPADPVGLQGLDRLGPVDAVEVQQFIGIFGGLEEPLLQVLLDDRRAAAFAVTVIAPDLLARQGRVAVRAPVHRQTFCDRPAPSCTTG